jgi:hypothetical protein
MYFKLGVTRDVDLPDPIVRNVIEVVVGIEIVILRRDIDVIHIEQDSAVSPLHDFG